MQGQFSHRSGMVTLVQLGGEPQFGSVVSYWNLVPSNVTSNRFAPANQLPCTEAALSNVAPVKSAFWRSCADRHVPGPNCTPWKLAARALLPLPVAAPHTLLAHWVLLKSVAVAVTPSNTVISNMVPENCASVRSTPFSVVWLRLASWKIAPVNRTGVGPVGWKVRHARFAMVKSAWLISMPARLAPPGQAFQLIPARLQKGQFFPALTVAKSPGRARAGTPTAAGSATASGRVGSKKSTNGAALASPACGCTKRRVFSPLSVTVASPDSAVTRAISLPHSSRGLTCAASSNRSRDSRTCVGSSK